ncbi:hypothetical protein Ahy_A01g000586 isoform B [Arachis hypogaea]|uniref:Uncharacterized protein n=1 Tax=Arachis hypogaea TaxID=3818 RepID=A0A445EKJ7_ARAHY|nr:hypothetical protein Ahy_A01g000586 isoform B [Arachis hypogaea]
MVLVRTYKVTFQRGRCSIFIDKPDFTCQRRVHTGLDAVGEEMNVDELGDIIWEDNNDSEEEFETNYKVDDENDDRDEAGNPAM